MRQPKLRVLVVTLLQRMYMEREERCRIRFRGSWNTVNELTERARVEQGRSVKSN